MDRAMKSDQLRLFGDLLSVVGEKHGTLPEVPLNGFLAMVGHKYDGGLMVVGRAVNGWIEGCTPSQLKDASQREWVVNEALASVTGTDRCPMLWVSDSWSGTSEYNTRRSAFWRVVRETVKGLGVADVEMDDWPSHLIWSNLYKMAPDQGGNPSGKVCSAQLEHCRELLFTEIATYKPKRVLFLTGLNWANSFLHDRVPSLEVVSGYHYVEAVGKMPIDEAGESVALVVAAHPQGKTEAVWVDEVVRVFEGGSVQTKSDCLGSWRIAEMGQRDRDCIDREIPGFIRFEESGRGEFQFGLVRGNIDWRFETLQGLRRIEFTWEGDDGGTPKCGRGWAHMGNDQLSGRFYIHMGDDLSFVASRR